MMWSNDDGLYILMIFMLGLSLVPMHFVAKKTVPIMIVAMVLVMAGMVLEIQGREERVKAMVSDFTSGEELICKDNNYRPLRISQSSWVIRNDRLAFKNDHGIDLLDNGCESIHASYKITSSQMALYLMATALYVIAMGMGMRAVTTKPKKKENSDEQ